MFVRPSRGAGDRSACLPPVCLSVCLGPPPLWLPGHVRHQRHFLVTKPYHDGDNDRRWTDREQRGSKAAPHGAAPLLLHSVPIWTDTVVMLAWSSSTLCESSELQASSLPPHIEGMCVCVCTCVCVDGVWVLQPRGGQSPRRGLVAMSDAAGRQKGHVPHSRRRSVPPGSCPLCWIWIWGPGGPYVACRFGLCLPSHRLKIRLRTDEPSRLSSVWGRFGLGFIQMSMVDRSMSTSPVRPHRTPNLSTLQEACIQCHGRYQLPPVFLVQPGSRPPRYGYPCHRPATPGLYASNPDPDRGQRERAGSRGMAQKTYVGFRPLRNRLSFYTRHRHLHRQPKPPPNITMCISKPCPPFLPP